MPMNSSAQAGNPHTRCASSSSSLGKRRSPSLPRLSRHCAGGRPTSVEVRGWTSHVSLRALLAARQSEPRLPFFFLPARFWLLLALARIAVDRSEAVLSTRTLLERIAFDSDVPHAGMQAFAADCLRALLTVIPPTEATLLGARLETVGT